MTSSSAEQYLTLSQAAGYLGISRTSLVRRLREGDMPGVRIHTSKRDKRAKLLKKSDLDAFADENPAPSVSKVDPRAA